MDAREIVDLIETKIPYVSKTGVLVDELSATKVRLRLPPDQSNASPMATVHAGALFTLGETAAAALCLVALGPTVMFIAKSAEVRFRRPARSEVWAVLQMTPLEAQNVLALVARDGKTDAAVQVDLVDVEKETLATVCVTMSVRRVG